MNFLKIIINFLPEKHASNCKKNVKIKPIIIIVPKFYNKLL